MKNTFKFIGITAIFAIIVFTMIACKDPSGDPDGIAFTTKGSFSVNEYILVSDGSRAITANSYSLKGKIKYSGTIYDFEGTYDPVKKTYTASLAITNFRVTVNGVINANTATALVAQFNGTEWVRTETSINTAAAVTITADTPAPGTVVTAGIIPPIARGFWREDIGNALVGASTFVFNYANGDSSNEVVVKVTSTGAQQWDVITSYKNVQASADGFLKYNITISGNTMYVKRYHQPPLGLIQGAKTAATAMTEAEGVTMVDMSFSMHR